MDKVWDWRHQEKEMGEIRAHTGLRGIAALLVVFYHLQFTQPHLPFEDATSFFRRGYLMVDLFFILSGFIISYVYTPALGHKLALRPFFLKRVIRLFPLHLFCLLTLLIGSTSQYLLLNMLGKQTEPLFTNESITALVSQIFLLNAWFPKEPMWNIPSWSISAELFAYALFPVLAVVLHRGRMAGSVCLIACSLLLYGIIVYDKGSLDVVSGWAPFRCGAGFMLGMVIHKHRRKFSGLPDGLVGIVQFTGLIGAIVVMAFPMNDGLAIPFFVIFVAVTWSDKGWLATLLGRSICQYLGRISYSVYLTHVVILGLLYPSWTAVVSRSPLDALTMRAIWILLAIFVVILISHFTYHGVEGPSRRWLTKHIVSN